MTNARSTRHPLAALLILVALAMVTLLAAPASSQAGSYIVAVCSPGVYNDAPDAGYSTNSNHFTAVKDCAVNQQGLQIGHVLVGEATGTNQGAFGAWVVQAPAGTFLTGGSVYSRLAAQNGIFGYLAVSTDSGSGVATENQNDDQLHLSAIPAGQWRYFSARLECTQPNQGARCVGPTPGAHTWVKQLRPQITDVTSPSLSIGGTMFSGAKLRSRQTIDVSAQDQGGGLRAVSVTVNNTAAAGDDLAGQCNGLPGGLVSRMAPCPGSFTKTYTLNTEDAPFHDGTNSVTVCVADFATEGTANSDCETREVFVDALCPESPRSGGSEIRGGFGNGKSVRVLPYGKKGLLRGRVLDAGGNGVAGAQICVQGHMLFPGRGYRLLGTPVTNDKGAWSFKFNRGASREFLVAYRSGGAQVEKVLKLNVRAKASLKISKRITRDQRKVAFKGCIPGPAGAERVVILRGSVPGARRSFLVRRARTDALGCYRMIYRFSPVGGPTLFVFTTLVPQQGDYPYLRGRSKLHYIKVRPCGAPCKHRGKGHKHKQRSQERVRVVGSPAAPNYRRTQNASRSRNRVGLGSSHPRRGRIDRGCNQYAERGRCVQ